MGPEHKALGTVTFKWDLDNFWLAWHFDQKKTKENPMPMTGTGYGTWDPMAKKWARWDFLPGSWSHLSSPGWEGDKMVFSGDTYWMGKKMGFRHTMTKNGDNELLGVFEMQGPDGKWMKAMEETCKRSGGAKKKAAAAE